jgi:hypothetical protein
MTYFEVSRREARARKRLFVLAVTSPNRGALALSTASKSDGRSRARIGKTMSNKLKMILTATVAAVAITGGSLALTGPALAKGMHGHHHHHRHGHHFRHWGSSIVVIDSSCSWRWVKTKWGPKKIYDCDDDD